MAYDAPGAYQYGFPADVDMSNIATQQFIALSLRPAQNVAGSGQGNTTCVPYQAGQPFVGILQNAPRQGDAATIMLRGISRCLVESAFAAGDGLAVAASGKLKKAASGDTIIGIAGESAVVGDISTVILR